MGAVGCESSPVKRPKAFEKIRPHRIGTKRNAAGAQDWKCLQVAVWKLRHWRASVAWIPAELLKILVFPNGGAQNPHTHGIGNKTIREGSQHMSSDHQSFLCLTFRCRACCRVRTNFVAQGARMHHGDVFSGKVVVPRFVGQLVGVNVSWEPWAY